MCLLDPGPLCAEATGVAPVLGSVTGDPVSSWTQITPPPGAPNPHARFGPAMTYFPSDHEVLLFGGAFSGGAPVVFYQDTWAFAHGHWTELIDNRTCTPTTCPEPRVYAMMTYYPTAEGVLLVGGLTSSPSTGLRRLADTWLFSGGSWRNLTAVAGTPPSARYLGSMVWDSLDGYVLLFGGAQTYSGTLGDTWTFDGTWRNITTSIGAAPMARAAAAISNSPSGYIMLFGGEHAGSTIEDIPNANCPPPPNVAWWYHHGNWTAMPEQTFCLPLASNLADPITGMAPPCGRVGAALGWSPQNQRFVLYGGSGPRTETSCTGTSALLNDTWTYGNPPGNAFYWQNATDPGDPPPRLYMGYASDFTDNYFEIYGGSNDVVFGTNDTWRFFELVHAHLSGPSSIETGATASFGMPFTVVGYGGTNDLSYNFTLVGLRTAHWLHGTGCAILGDNSSAGLPYDGLANVTCQPTPQSYNIYRLTLHVHDNNNATNRADANWTFVVNPPETAVVYSRYVKYFYTNFDYAGNNLDNVFSAELEVANRPAARVAATLGGIPLTFTERASAPLWWDSDGVDMGTVAPGSILLVHADFSDWSLNATYHVQMIDTPSWLYSIFRYTGAAPSVQTQGAGPYNKTYSISESYSWNLGQALGFTIPVPMVGGNYSLVPSIAFALGATSEGDVSLTGGFSLESPKIDLGVASMTLTASLNLTGTFALTTQGASVTGVVWESARAVISLTGDFSASVPIYGFDILGIHIGFTLEIEVKPSVALGLVLVPTTHTASELVQNIQIMVSSVFGTFALPISVGVSFGIGIASAEVGGTLELDLSFGLSPTLGILGGWVNGSVFASVTALFWSDSWTLLGPATIYSWHDPPARDLASAGLAAVAPVRPAYNNGTGTTWRLNSRYYATSGYDANVWTASASQGVAISDIYPHTEISGAAGSNGAYLFYSDDDTGTSVQQGLTVSGLRLDPSTNRLTATAPPNDPGFVLDRPEAATLPDGSIYVVWAALPVAETALASPIGITSLELHGARFYPANETWGPVRRWTSAGLAESYALDGTTGSGRLAVLVASSFLLGDSTPERVLEFDLATGAEVANASVSGISEVVSARGTLGEATVVRLDGNDSIVNLASGATVPLGLSVAAGDHLISEAFVTGSASTLLLLIRSHDGARLVLYDLGSGQSLATLPVAEGTFEVHGLFGGGTYYVFAASTAGVEGWTEAGGSFQNLSTFGWPGVKGFAAVQAGSSLALFALATNGDAEAPIVNLTLGEIAASLPVVPSAPASSSGSPSNTPWVYLLLLGAVAAVDAILIGVWAIRARRRSRSPGEGSARTPPTPPPKGP